MFETVDGEDYDMFNWVVAHHTLHMGVRIVLNGKEAVTAVHP